VLDGLESEEDEEEPDEELDEDADDDSVDVDGLDDAGELLDEEPRLSLR
jgi:hypothetical protein